jgi:WD40 repeat protein
MATLTTLVIGAFYLDGSPRSRPARQVSLGGSTAPSRAIAFGPGGELRVATLLAGATQIWRIGPGSGRAAPSGPALPGFAWAFSPDGATTAVGGHSTVTIREANAERPTRTFKSDDGRISALAFRRDGGMLASAGERGVSLWDTKVGGERAAMRIGLRGGISLAFGPDGRSLATGGQDGYVRLWDLATGRQRLVVQAHARDVNSLAFSDDGRTLASASVCDQVARLWDVASGRGLVALAGHTALVQSVAFAPGGRTVATGGADETVRIWDVASGRELANLRCPGVRVGVLAFSPDGRALAAGGFEPEVRVWDVSSIPEP